MPTKFVDLFAGIGSFHYSFVKKGWECVMACDIYKPAKDTYISNFDINPSRVKDDICNIDPSKVEDYDILCAGFPCQPFSQIGKQKGVNDERGTMFWQVMKFVKTNKPQIVILENVPALVSHNQGKTFNTIIQELKDEEYMVCHRILKCSDYGIPQMRKRLFIVAIKPSALRDNVSLENLFELEEYRQHTNLSDYLGKNFTSECAYTIRCGGRHSPLYDRHNWDGYIVDGQEYRLTIEDGLKLQGFSNYKLLGSDTQKWKMLGNTIPTNLTELLATQLIRICKL